MTMFYSALIGRPVDHSVSPVLFNYFANQAGLEYSHLKIDIQSRDQLGDAMDSLRSLDFCGINVTLPYKLDVIKYLDRLNPEAKKIGAVNTVVFKNGQSVGYNTDALGALSAIEFKLKELNKRDQVLIFGSGGAARAIIFSLYQKTKNIVILSRDLLEAEAVSRDLSGGKILFFGLTDQNIKKYLEKSEVIVNATPVGMYPRIAGEIIPQSIWRLVSVKNKYFFDAVFNPYKTKFIQEAKARGAKVCPGTYMMIFQAIEAFRLWTGVSLTDVKIEKINYILKKYLRS